MSVVMDISDRVVVLDYGKKIGDGTPDEVRANPDVVSAYLGTSH
jgi:branched-chain amino acid transport system ATP-binding protein